MAPDSKMELLKQIHDELKQQGELKKQLLAELKPQSRLARLAEIAKHPIILLILGSVLGAILTARYQSGEWNRQQHVLRERQKIDLKTDVENQVIEELTETYAAARTAVRPLFYEDAATFKTKMEERATEWDKANQKWQVTQYRLPQKLADFFKEPGAQIKLKEILNIRGNEGSDVYVEVNNILADVKTRPQILDENLRTPASQTETFKAFRQSMRFKILVPTSQARIKIDELKQIMQTEIRKDLEALDSDRSFWRFFF